MTAACSAEYEDHGWTLLRRFFSIEEVLLARAWCSDVLQRPILAGAQMVYRETSLNDPMTTIVKRIEYFCGHHTPLDKLLRSGRHLAFVEVLLGGPAVLFKEKINSKFPGGSGYAVHQDQQAGWSAFAPLFVTAMICLDHVSIENGGFQLAINGRYRHLVAGEWSDLSAKQAANCKLRDVDLAPGDLLLFDSFVPHGSGPNLTSTVRRALFATYNLAVHGDHRETYFALKRASSPPCTDEQTA
jgi:ectoine hydroxylase-related dioxygenase (phytanoyl-CoA dioxygenase family)